ncbi:MAG: MBL fold metallo-hydrolase [Phycisphaerae bacterium]|nr:MBL fold metallo-hydrolase [Phycisphaerae bacterium]
MPIEIKWIHHASFRISAAEQVIYIDPWKLTGAPHDADVVFVSHSHYDHCSPEDVAKVSKDDTAIVAPAETIAKLGAANAAAPGESISIKDITIECVAAYNISKSFHPKGNNWLGAVFTIAGKRIYYAGDTDLVPEMSDLTDVDVALLPIGGTYTLDAAEAAKACQVIGPKAAIGYHWGDIVGDAGDAKKFADAAPCKVHMLQPGETVEI